MRTAAALPLALALCCSVTCTREGRAQEARLELVRPRRESVERLRKLGLTDHQAVRALQRAWAPKGTVRLPASSLTSPEKYLRGDSLGDKTAPRLYSPEKELQFHERVRTVFTPERDLQTLLGTEASPAFERDPLRILARLVRQAQSDNRLSAINQANPTMMVVTISRDPEQADGWYMLSTGADADSFSTSSARDLLRELDRRRRSSFPNPEDVCVELQNFSPDKAEALATNLRIVQLLEMDNRISIDMITAADTGAETLAIMFSREPVTADVNSVRVERITEGPWVGWFRSSCDVRVGLFSEITVRAWARTRQVAKDFIDSLLAKIRLGERLRSAFRSSKENILLDRGTPLYTYVKWAKADLKNRHPEIKDVNIDIREQMLHAIISKLIQPAYGPYSYISANY